MDSLHNIIRKSVSLRSIIQRTSFNPQLPPSNTHQSLQLDENLQNAIWHAKPIDIKDGSKSGSLYDVIFSITHPEYEGSELDMYKVIVATFPTIKLNPMDLLQLLLARLKPLDSLKQTELAKKVQLKTLSILRWWIKTNPNDLSLEVSSEITQYTKYVDTEAVIFIETIDKMLQKGARMQCIDPAHLPPMNVQVPDRISSCLEVIFGVPDVLVAHQLVVISSQLFIKILPTEFMNLAWSDEGLKHRATNIIAFVERANLLSKWVVTTILTKENAASRAKLIKRFIKIGMILLELRDFNSLMGLVVGISNSSITRLRKSWALIGDKLIENWNFISHLMSPEKGFTHYREYVSKINDPLIPLLTVYLSDLILISEGNPTYTDQNSTIINLTKLEQIYKVIVRIQTFQSSTKSLKTMQKMEPLFTLLTNLPSLPDENLYEISLWVEPREMVAKFPPLLYRGQTFSALQAHGFSTEEVGEIIDLVVENHIEDPRWVYVSKNIEKRRQVMKVVFGHTIRWCSKQSCSIFVKHARSKNPNEPKRIVAVSVFLEPYSRIKAPISTLVFEIGRLVVNAGTKVAGRVKQVIKGIEDFVAKYEPEHCWEFFYLCVTPEYINDREYWEDIVWRVLSKADSDKLPVWTYFTDIKRMDMLRSWGFSDVVSGSLIENKIQMWGTGRSPNRWDISEHSNDSLLYRSEDHSFLERSRSNIL
uniref:Ras-GEF domain-containing protein n=1 Tax=Arcella intermedia TaxID=1963864 RepID=A0A6B2KYP2_9EUKA